MELVACNGSVGCLTPQRRRYPRTAPYGGAAATEEDDVVPRPRPGSVGAAIRAHLSNQAVPAAKYATLFLEQIVLNLVKSQRMGIALQFV